MEEIIDSITRDWLECFDDSVKEKEDLSKSVFWRLALHTLPEGVNPNNSRVKDALKAIKESCDRKGGDV